MTERKSFCRICFGTCGLIVKLDDNARVTSVRGDPDHPLTSGFACSKGVTSGELHNSDRRLLRPLKRMPDGSHAEIGIEQALDEIAERLKASVAAHGSNSHAIYQGMGGSLNAAVRVVLRGWLNAMGSTSYYSSMTIDQSAKWVSFERLGMWAAGNTPFDTADVWMGFGFNPLVSVSGALSGFNNYNPVARLKAAKARGAKIIVIDPRRTETARLADIHLQPIPGEDSAIAAGFLNLALSEGREDSEFCAAHAEGLDDLRAAVAPFTPAHVAARAGIDEALFREAADIFFAAKRGGAFTGTGPNMATGSNLSQHLIDALNVVCGRYPRAGDAVPNPGVLGPRKPVHAEAISPGRSFERNGMLFGQKMTGALASAITGPGPDRIRSLIVVGGNLVSAMPDQARSIAALSGLDLLVTIDPQMNATARLADYVLPPRLMFERDDMTMVHNERNYFPAPFAQYAPAIAAEPEGAELIDDHALFWGLAKRLGLTLDYGGQALDMGACPSGADLLAITAAHSQIPFAEIKAREGGAIWPVQPQIVEPARPGAGRFQLLPPDVAEEFAEMARGEPVDPAYPFRLVVRRMREVMNSFGRHIPSVQRRKPENRLQLHPDDLAALGIETGEQVMLRSAHGAIPATVETDDTLRPGTVTLTHGWGELPGDRDAIGVAINRLTDAGDTVERINAMPRFSALPVRIERCAA
ncbi:molybdopterin-dependent oxidoreductase [Sphingomonas sp. AOB5]|uniref:molybdopterin-containing oxidoreductase family protein n=1 Tax=Sphingomonas sp. AOB5 TaxID=3034017 RepID=UPI0023F7E86D|nr:molybdopterin-dependent oxidoreductase [Sphingomonas sp. AOB5]MDF7774764.1 molybdopterin-dependent oxidoreductase [Sphingomonas sp. AOB5]